MIFQIEAELSSPDEMSFCRSEVKLIHDIAAEVFFISKATLDCL
jgi:hypothetical protein